MKNVSTEFKKIEKSGGPFYAYAKCTLLDGTELNFDSYSDFYAEGNSFSESGGDGFPLGVALSKQITITIDNHDDRYSTYDFYGAKIVLYTEADLPDGTKERILEGTFTVIDSVAPDDALEINAYDNMYKLDADFTSSLSYPVALQQLWNELCNYYDLGNGSPTFLNDNYVVQSRPETVTGREMAGYIAQIAVGNAYVNTNGQLCIKSYDFSPFDNSPNLSGGKIGESVPDTVSAGGFGDGLSEIVSGGEFGESLDYYILSDFTAAPEIATDDVTITGITTVIEDEESGEETTLVFGTEDYALEIDNPLIIGNEEQAITVIGQALKGVTIRPFSGDFSPAPSLEFMDMVVVIDRKDNVYPSFVTDHAFTYLGGSSISNGTESPERNAASYSSNATKIYKKVQKDLIKQRTAWETAIGELSDQVANASGLYTTEEEQPDGSTIFYMHNKPTLEESDIIWKMTAETLTVSTDGGKTWNAGITVNGEVIAKIMSTIGINFDWGVGGTLIIEDEDGNQTAYIDADTGTVRLSVEFLSIAGKTVEEIANQQVNDFVDAVYTPGITNLQAQIDGQIETYYYDYEPTLTNEPASEWTTETERQKHEGDLFYWKSKGYAYRFFKDGNTWKWQMVQDTDITAALEQAAQAQDTADQKRRVFVSTPVPPYDVGDLWTQGANGDIMRCQTSRQSGAYNSNDWVKASKYTDNTFAQEVQEELQNLQIGGRNLSLGTADWNDTAWVRGVIPSAAIISGNEVTTPVGNTSLNLRMVKVEEGDTFTLSYDIKSTANYSGDTVLLQYYAENVDSPDDPAPTRLGYTFLRDDVKTNFSRASHTFTLSGDFAESGTFDGVKYLLVGLRSDSGYANTWRLLKIEKGNKPTDWTPAPEDTETYADNLFSDLQDQLDGKIETWNQTNDPSPNWAMPDFSHEGDLWYNPNTKETKRWNGFSWDKIENKEAEDAAELAQSKAQVFTTTPYPPYYVGDLWITALNKTGVVKTCKTTRTSGSYNASDWVEGLKYTDDSAVDELNEVLNQTEIFNRLTNNGKTQGIYMQNGLIYVNASYIQTGILSVKDTKNNETFYANTETGEVRIKATSFSLTSGKTIEDIAQDAVDNIQIGGRNLLRDTDAPSLKKISGPADRRFSNNMDGVNAIGSYIEVSDSPCSSKYGVQIEIKNANGTDSGCWIVFYDRLTEKSMDITFEVGEEYTLSCYIRSISGNPEHHMAIFGRTTYGGYFPVTTEWKRYSDTFIATESMNTEENARAVFGCNANAVGIIQLTGFKLEKGSKPTDWSPAPEDVQAYTNDKVNSLDTSLNQQDIFNRLTNNGQDQGIYLKNNKIYVNASYIQSGTLRLGGINNQYGVLQIMSSTNTPIGTWDKDGINITNNGTIRNKVNNNEIEIAGGRMDINYSDTDVGFIGSNLFNNEPGLVFDLQDGNFMTWSVQSEESSQFVVKFYYIKNGFNNYQSDSLNVAADMYFWSHNMHMQGNDIQMDGGDISDVNLVNAWVKQGSSFNVPTNTTLNFKSPLNMNSKDIQNANLDNVWVKANAQFVAANNSLVDFYTQLNMHGYAINNSSLNDIKLNDISSINGRAPISRQVYLPTLIDSDGTCSSWIVVDIEDGLIVSS